MKVEVLGFDEMKELYDVDPNFSKVWRECRVPNLTDHISKYDEYFIQEGMLFKGIQLCIPRSSMRLNLIKEKHSGGLAGHFGIDKTLSLLKEKYYWTQMYNSANTQPISYVFDSIYIDLPSIVKLYDNYTTKTP